MQIKNIDYRAYRPNKKTKETVEFVYDELELMVKERNETRRQFNDRTLIQYVDDSDKRVQGYVPTKESQGKDDWQSNVFNQATRNKLKAFIAAVALTPPKIKLRGVTPEGMLDPDRADVMNQLVKHSRLQTNPETEIFWEAWECAGKGTVIKYDGYLKTQHKQKFLTSYNLETGDLDWEEREVIVDDRCIDELVPIPELFIHNFFISDIQKQPALAWVRYLDANQAEFEFEKFANWKYVPIKSNLDEFKNDTETFFQSKWSARLKKSQYEVIKYYNKLNDQYIIIVNGVLLLDSPLLWGRKQKYYPFSKTIFEPFAERNFFYGNSLPNANQDAQDVLNSIYNMLLDKTYRSLSPSMLVGQVNKDLLDLEDEELGLESTIYVQDITQVDYMKVPSATQPELTMLNLASRGLDLGTVDSTQQGVTGKGVTAREVVIANENAKKMKGIFFMFLTDLWIQKTRLRIYNILLNYSQPQVEEVAGKEKVKTYKTFLIPNQELTNGQTGTLAIDIVGDQTDFPTPKSITKEEEAMSKKGENFEKLVLLAGYLDNIDYDIEIVSESLHGQDMAQDQMMVAEKMQGITSMFPEIFAANKGVLFADFLKAYQDHPERYQTGEGLPNPQEGMDQGNLPKTGTQKTGMTPIQGMPNIKREPYNQ